MVNVGLSCAKLSSFARVIFRKLTMIFKSRGFSQLIFQYLRFPNLALRSCFRTCNRGNTPMSELALEVSNLSKSFDRPAVNNLSFNVKGGEFYALLGPNGAGKTTSLRMVAGLLQADAGDIHVFGENAVTNPIAVKQMMAWVPDEPMIYDRLTPLEYLEFVAGLWGIEANKAEKNASELLEWLGLEPHMHERCEGFSKGMRQKVALAGALVHDPRLIILDEPLTGLDAGSARLVKDVLLARVERGCSVIMTTHILEVAERMAERIGVISKGRLIAEGTLETLRNQVGGESGTLEEIFLGLVESDVDTHTSQESQAA